MHSSIFLNKGWFLKHEISGSHTISDQSLLLSTTVLNDVYDVIKYTKYK